MLEMVDDFIISLFRRFLAVSYIVCRNWIPIHEVAYIERDALFDKENHNF